MPTETSQVGPTILPYPAGAANTAIVDPTVVGLLAYFAYWLQFDLNAKIQNLAGTTQDVCPSANQFPWNPLDPKPSFMWADQTQTQEGLCVPALYVWLEKGKIKPYSTVTDMLERRGGVLWLYDQLVLPGAQVFRQGLRGAVEASLARAASLGRHPAFSLAGGPSGVPIEVALQLTGDGMWIEDSQQGFLSPITNQGNDADQAVYRAYPSVQCTLVAQLEISSEQPLDSDQQTDASVIASIGGHDPAHPLPFGTRLLPGPDQG